MQSRRGTNDMPKEANPELKEGAVYISQKAASEKWERENPQEKLIIRLPEGSKDKLKDYVQRKADEEPDNPKYNSFNGKAYRPSINAMIKALLEAELGEEL